MNEHILMTALLSVQYLARPSTGSITANRMNSSTRAKNAFSAEANFILVAIGVVVKRSRVQGGQNAISGPTKASAVEDHS